MRRRHGGFPQGVPTYTYIKVFEFGNKFHILRFLYCDDLLTVLLLYMDNLTNWLNLGNYTARNEPIGSRLCTGTTAMWCNFEMTFNKIKRSHYSRVVDADAKLRRVVLSCTDINWSYKALQIEHNYFRLISSNFIMVSVTTDHFKKRSVNIINHITRWETMTYFETVSIW